MKPNIEEWYSTSEILKSAIPFSYPLKFLNFTI